MDPSPLLIDMESRSPDPPTVYRLPLRDRLPGPLGALLSFPWWQLAVAGAVGYLLGELIHTPNSRIIKAIAGLVLFGIARRTQPFYALCFIVLMFPFPFSIFVGSSTMIFIVVACLVYLGRLTLKQTDPPARTPVDAGMGILVACYLLSFYNVDNPEFLRRGLINFFAILASFLLFYITASFIRNEDQLKTMVKVLTITIALSVAIGLYELVFPGQVLVPHWITLGGGGEAAVGDEGYRVGGPLSDYELFGEFMAMSFFISYFHYRRSTFANSRFFGMSLAVLCVFLLLTTVTRGATLAFVGGFVYLMWCIRSRLRFRDVVTVLLVAAGLYAGMEFILVNFTTSGSVLDRLLGTTFVGFLPDSRTGWVDVWDRVLDHPFVGHGPYYDLGLAGGLTGRGLYTHIWPHNQYLFYAHTIGLIGLGAFLFVSGRLLHVSFRFKAKSLKESSYAESLMVVLHVMLLVFLVDQIKIDYLRNDIYLYFPWILMGMIAATHRIILRQRSARAEVGAP